MTKKRIEEVDVLRGFAAISMVIGHSFIKTPVDISDVGWCRALYYVINCYHMELFFVLAGFVFSCKAYGQYIKKKVYRILIPYAVFGILAMFLHVYGGSAVNRIGGLGDELFSFVFKGGSFWFLYVIFELYLIFPLIDRLKKEIPWIEYAISILCIVIIQLFNPSEFLRVNSFLHYLPFFTLGYEAKRLYEMKKNLAGGGYSPEAYYHGHQPVPERYPACYTCL